MTISQFSALSLSAQVSHLKALDHYTAPMWLCLFADAYFKFHIGGLLCLSGPYVTAWHTLDEYRTECMNMTPQELDFIWSSGCGSGRQVSKSYPSISYTHS